MGVMKLLISLITSMLLLQVVANAAPAAEDMRDMRKYLDDTHDLAKTGEFDQALLRYAWFHDHALKFQPSISAVRLSEAIGAWKELGDKHPPAMKALLDVRDRKTKALLDGKGKKGHFVDVAAINEALEEKAKTVELFEILDRVQPKVAESAWFYCRDDLVEAKRYELVAKYIGDPHKDFSISKRFYELNKRLYDDPEIGGEGFINFNKQSFTDRSLQLIEVMRAIGEDETALEIQKKALEVLDSPGLREAMQ